MLDDKFAEWVGHLVKEHALIRRPQPSSVEQGPVDGCCCWKQYYSRIQNLYGLNKSACMDKVINGSWGVAMNKENFSLNQMCAAWKESLKPFCLVFLDVKKAFDSVSHNTIQLALCRMGCPEPMLSCVWDLYSRSLTVLEYASSRSDPLKVHQGVKQGDPLSPMIFNAVLDWALQNLDQELGFEFEGIRLNNLAYANDVVLLSETKAGLSSLFKSFEGHLAKCGLFISVVAYFHQWEGQAVDCGC